MHIETFRRPWLQSSVERRNQKGCLSTHNKLLVYVMSGNRFICEKLQKLYWLNYVETKCYHRRIIWKIGPPRWIGKCGSVPAKLANSRTARSGAAWSLANGKRQAWRGAGGDPNVTRPMHGSGPGDTCGECEPRGKVLSDLFTHWSSLSGSGVQVVLKKTKYRFKNMWIKQNFKRFQRSVSNDLNKTVLTINNTLNFFIYGQNLDEVIISLT